MKRVAIPLVEDRLSEYFGKCSYYEIFEIDHKTIKSSKIGILSHQDMNKIPDWVMEKGITDVIIHKMDKKIFSLLADTKINLFVGIPIDTPDTIIQRYLTGSLKSDTKIIGEIIQ
jgi:predicted Fe-Mo cluster-binding NifX family protein